MHVVPTTTTTTTTVTTTTTAVTTTSAAVAPVTMDATKLDHAGNPETAGIEGVELPFGKLT